MRKNQNIRLIKDNSSIIIAYFKLRYTGHKHRASMDIIASKFYVSKALVNGLLYNKDYSLSAESWDKAQQKTEKKLLKYALAPVDDPNVLKYNWILSQVILFINRKIANEYLNHTI